MAVGVPVVATTAGALPEVLGDAACLVAPGDRDALAAGLLALADDAERARFAAWGRERVRRYTWDACAAGLAALYRRAAAR
jgi:glycosyltransferase involved in cell wall biosynthesis